MSIANSNCVDFDEKSVAWEAHGSKIFARPNAQSEAIEVGEFPCNAALAEHIVELHNRDLSGAQEKAAGE
ncbi:hypothetical protein [Pseudomonas putida]|uniref:Uncharacterized protein n=1 Tax=Pseudomonas putida TaxID=303 RepID=A0A8I1EIG8_PSEPU|nr:hypothetical protein [Pseudomonas putida]MBI6885783.1 hypothetical protein [Pseudomonas putida]